MMKRLKKFMFSPKGTIAAFGAAVVLLLLSSAGGARAALTYYSENHETSIETQAIGVSLVEEGGVTVASRSSSGDQDGKGTLALPAINAEGTDGKAKVGATYAENLSVRNSGQIDQYVRVTIYKNWKKGGETQRDLNPRDYIELAYADGWTEDTSASTLERTVLYYTGGPLASGASVPVVKSIRINPEVSKVVKLDGTYSYQDCSFEVSVEVDAVQTHNAEDAILSAWGKTVTVNGDGSLTLN